MILCPRSAVAVLLAAASMLVLSPWAARAQSTAPAAEHSVTLTPQWNAQQTPIPPNFAGLSYESAYLLADKDNHYYFGPGRQTLIGMFRTLGVHSLRIGGNTADRPGVPIPHGTDIDNLFQFAAAAHVKVIYTLRLRPPSNPVDDAATAAYIMHHYADQMDTFAVGNEPDIYFHNFDAYRDAEQKFIATIHAESPQAHFSGPGTTGGKPSWTTRYADDLGKSGLVQLITEHRYAGGNARKVTDPAAARLDMLSQKWTHALQKFYDGFGPAVLADGLPYRLEETNSYYNGGAKDVSDTYAAALWGLDYLYWWAEHHATGVNFHTGDTVAAGEQNTPCRYAVFTRNGDGYDVHPLGYAMTAFELGAHGGKLVPITLDTHSTADLNLRAYGVSTIAQTFYLTLINKDASPGARPLPITVNVGPKYARADAMALAAPHNDLAATTGLTLGGAAIDNNANWNGNWTALQPPTGPGKFAVTISPASAMVIRFVIP